MALSLRRKAGGGSSGAAAPLVDVVVTQDDLRDLVRAINRYGDAKAVRKELRTGLREAVKPLVPKARSAVRSQSGGPKSTGLRNDMARSVEVKVDLGLRSERIGVRLRLNGAKLRDRPRGLIFMYEGVRPWRHPVFGDRDTWVAQPARGFLTEVARAGWSGVLADVEKVTTDIARKIDG